MNPNESDQPALKAELRSRMRNVLAGFPPEKRQSDSEKLCLNLKEQAFFKNARAILFFAPLPDEPDLWSLVNETIAGKKMVALPCFDTDNEMYLAKGVKDIHVEIVSGKFGVREPAAACIAIPIADLDLVLVPGVAFDEGGHRLGRGKGFYDRLLQDFTGDKIGIAFDEQVVDQVPAGPTDVKMSAILTPLRFLKCP